MNNDPSRQLAARPPLSAGYDARLVTELRGLRDHYPQIRGALLPILTRLQEVRGGYLSLEDLSLAGEIVELSPAEVYSVMTFYTMYRLKKPGDRNLGVCRNFACWLCGAEEIVAVIERELKIHPGEVTEDGKFSLEELECLGSCDTAPVLEVDGRYFEKLTADRVRRLLVRLREGADLDELDREFRRPEGN